MAHTEKCRGCMYENACNYITCRKEEYKTFRNKIVDEFAKKLKYEFGSDEIHEVIDEVAKSMKG